MALTLSGADKPRQQPQAQQKAPSPPVAPSYAPYPNWQAEACYNAKNHDAADLCAQWRAAVATEKAAHEAKRATAWSIVATVFSAFAFGVLLWSLIQTERSLKESRRGNVLNMRENARATRRAIASAKETSVALEAANKSAVAAGDQVEIAKETAYRQLRAYLSVEAVKPNKVHADIITGDIVIRNAGQTPAAIKVYFQASIEEFPLIDARTKGPPATLQWQHKPFINRGCDEVVYWWFPISAGKPDAAAIEAKAKADIAKLLDDPVGYCFYLYGRIEFTDYMRRERVLHFQFRSAGNVEMGKRFEMMPMPTGNDYEDRSQKAQH